MIADKFTKFLLSVIATFLCLITLNPWLSPPLVNAEATKTFEQMDKSNKLAIIRLIAVIEKWAKYEIAVHQKATYSMPYKSVDEAYPSKTTPLSKTNP